MNEAAGPATCSCPCLTCRRIALFDEGPLGVVRDYWDGACECGLPAEDEFRGAEEFWFTCETCRTRWYAGYVETEDFELAPWKLQYREIPGDVPAWVEEAEVAFGRAVHHLVWTTKVSHDRRLCSQHDDDVDKDKS